MKALPAHLFHYTSIANLSLILRSKRLRFQRLDKMKDPEEAKTESFPDAKYFIYVSCWTAQKDNKESLPLWNMYSSDMKGVRIRLPINMFKGRNHPDDTTTGFPIIHTECQLKIIRKDSCFPGMIVGPMPIKYKKKLQKAVRCFEEKDSIVDVNLLHIGQFKHDHWSFEEEWRYKIIGMPFEGKWQKKDYDYFLNNVPQNQYIDVPLDDSVIKEMIIQLGPGATLAEKIIVDLLVKEYAKGAQVCDSSVKINK